jgi:hypothetical protein
MRFPYLNLVLARRSIPQWRLARVLKISESAFCRKLAGRGEFSALERRLIAEELALTESWLFTEVDLPASARLAGRHEVATLCPAETR